MPDSDPAPPKSEIEWAEMKRTDPADPRSFEFSIHSTHQDFLGSIHQTITKNLKRDFVEIGWQVPEPDQDLATIQANTAEILRRVGKSPNATAKRNSTLASLAEAREYLGDISRKSFDRHVRPHLTSVPIGGRDHFEWKELDRWLDAQKAGPSNEIPAQRTISSASRMQAAESSDPAAQQIAERLKASRRASTKKSPKSGK
jgi:hypothetical protein